MMDGIIKADGTSRMVRAELPATYAEFRDLAAAGKLPLDIMVNEAGWRQVPTWLNKANLLQDVTAALCGTPEDQFAAVTPDDILRRLGRFHSGMGNEYFWRMDDGTVYHWHERDANAMGGISWYRTTGTMPQYTRYYASTYQIVNGKFVLNSPQTITTGMDKVLTDMLPVLRNKYMVTYLSTDGTYDSIYRVPPGASGTTVLDGYYYRTTVDDFIEMFSIYPSTNKGKYVNADNPNAYPPAVSDGHTYTYVGRLGDFTSVVTGSYVGDGLYGAEYPNNLTFPSPPKLVIVMDQGHEFSASYQSNFFIWYPGITTVAPSGYTSGGGNIYRTMECNFTLSGNTLQWAASVSYDPDKSYYSGRLQANAKGIVYHWFALL